VFYPKNIDRWLIDRQFHQVEIEWRTYHAIRREWQHQMSKHFGDMPLPLQGNYQFVARFAAKFVLQKVQKKSRQSRSKRHSGLSRNFIATLPRPLRKFYRKLSRIYYTFTTNLPRILPRIYRKITVNLPQNLPQIYHKFTAHLPQIYREFTANIYADI
jgi:hypothetical protein